MAAAFVAPAGISAGDTLNPPPGDGPADAPMIRVIPGTLTGDTTALTDQFDAVCPYVSTSPDAWYRLELTDVPLHLTLSLCQSGYDTKLYVLDEAFEAVACNDDACSDASGLPFRSFLDVELDVGELVYVVVDGWSGDAGTYELEIGASYLPPCPGACEPGMIPEDEPCSTSGGVDVVNGGCNHFPVQFTEALPGDVICGLTTRASVIHDFDWYRLHVPEGSGPQRVTATIVTDGEVVAELRGVDVTCETEAMVDWAVVDSCEIESFTVEQPAGTDSLWRIHANPPETLCEGGTFDGPANYTISFTSVPLGCPGQGDLDGDGVVGFVDLLAMLSAFGDCPEGGVPCPALGDLDGDGAVDFDDVVSLLAAFGACR